MVTVSDPEREETETLPPGHRSGFVAVVGRPNVGKSTLMNLLLGEGLAIVSPKPQTTRDRQLGILTEPDYQIVFVDTPGIHKSRNRLGEFMVEVASASIPDADVVLFLVDVSEMPGQSDQIIAGLIGEAHVSAVLVLNKVDRVDKRQADQHAAAYRALVPDAIPVMISALQGTNRETLLQLIVDQLPQGPRFYPAEQLTNTHIRDNAAEIVREKVLHLFEDEVPHSVAVQVDECKERSQGLTYIGATIYVEKGSQKAIVIGKGGSMLKKLGAMARADLEELLGTRVYLELWVKVLKNWRKDERALRRLGYDHRK